MVMAQSHSTAEPAPPLAADSDADDALVRYVTRLGAARGGHHAVHFHLSRIARNYRTRKHLRVAASMLKELMAPLPRPPFLLKNGEQKDAPRPGKDVGFNGLEVARLGRLELPAYRFEVCRSIQLSYRRLL